MRRLEPLGLRAQRLVLGSFDENDYIKRQADALERLLAEKGNRYEIAG